MGRANTKGVEAASSNLSAPRNDQVIANEKMDKKNSSDSQAGQSTLNRLTSPEILSTVMPYLRLEDTIKVARVCKSLH